MYDLGERLLMVASDRISTYDVIHPTPIPGKGQVLTGISVFWFGLTERHRSQPPRLGHRRRSRARCAGAPWRCSKLRDAADRVRGARLPVGLGLEGLPGAPARCAGSRCPPGCASHSSCPSRSSRRPPRPSWASTTRTSTSRPPWPRSATAQLAERVRDVSIALYQRAAEHARRARDHPGRHQVRVRARPAGHAGARRRGAHARLLALLARRSVRAGPRAAQLRQAVRARLGLGHRLGPHRSGAGAARRDRGIARASCTSRPTSGSPASRSTAWLERVQAADARGPASGSRHEGAGARAAQGRHPRPPGPGRRARATRARLRRRAQRARRAA